VSGHNKNRIDDLGLSQQQDAMRRLGARGYSYVGCGHCGALRPLVHVDMPRCHCHKAAGKESLVVELQAKLDRANARITELEAGHFPVAAKHGSRFWSDDPEGSGLQWHRSRAEAVESANEAISVWTEECDSYDGEWPEMIQFISWGVTIDIATPVENEDGDVVRYELSAVEPEEKL